MASKRLDAPARRQRLPLMLFPVLAVVLAGAGYATLPDTVGAWLVRSVVTPEQALPFVAGGIALGVASRVPVGLGLAGMAIGLAVGYLLPETGFAVLGYLPHALANDFFVGPMAMIAAGLALLCPRFLRPAGFPVCFFLIGTGFALWIHLTDPTLHDPRIPIAGISAAVALLVLAAGLVHAFYRVWLEIPARILGSWLVAIGTLYGGAYLATPPAGLSPPIVDTTATPERGIAGGGLPGTAGGEEPPLWPGSSTPGDDPFPDLAGPSRPIP